MKLVVIICLQLLSLEAFGQQFRLPKFLRGDRDEGGLRAVWHCPTRNRGDMPEEKEIKFSYDESGRLKLDPDIFRMGFNPINEMRNLIGKRRSSADLDVCLQSFVENLPAAIRAFRVAECDGNATRICTLSAAAVELDALRVIRESRFFTRYQEDLAPVAGLLNPSETTPTTTPDTVTETLPDPTPPDTVVTTPPDTVVTTPPDTVVTTPPDTVVTTPPDTVVTTPPDTAVTTPPDTAVTTPPETVPDTAPRLSREQERARIELLDYMTDNYARIGRLKEFARHCPDLGSTTGGNAAYCSYHMRENSRFLNRLSQLFSQVRNESVSVARILSSLECLPEGVNEFSGVEEILRSLDRKDDCTPLNQIGDFKVFRKTHGPSWYTTGNYLLKKSGDDEYEATMVVNFKDMGGNGTPEEMMNRVRGCLASVNRHMSAPDGSRLRLRVLSPDEASTQLRRSERPLTDEINIRPNGTAVDSANFTIEDNCPTIAHELLHHLGLCDEYREDRTNLVHGMTRTRAQEWSCRVVPEGPSIMKNHIEAYNMAVAQELNCECNNAACRTVMVSSSADAEAKRKILMTESMYAILGQYSQHCPNPVSTTGNWRIEQPDKAYLNVRVDRGTLSFENRNLFAHGNDFSIGRRTVTCQCPAGDQACERAFARAAVRLRENPQQTSCPSHTTPRGSPAPASEGAVTSLRAEGYTLVTRPELPSLLTPNQFDKILTGACTTSPSAAFKRCSDFAYISTDSPACAEKPANCSDAETFTGARPQ